MIGLNALKEELNIKIINPDFKDLKQILSWFSELDIEGIHEHFMFEDNHYCRVPLIANNSYDLLLCCWKSGQQSEYHGHPDQGCLVKILSGTLTEDIKFTNGTVETRNNCTGDVAYINDETGVHKIKNNSSEEAVSLHLYAPGGYKPKFLS